MRPSRREARLARKAQDQIEDTEKSARLAARPEFQIARREVDPSDLYNSPMTWSCAAPDIEGQWSWGVDRQWTDGDWTDLIQPRLVEWSKLTWAEIDIFSSESGHKMHHGMDVDTITDEAQIRLIEKGIEGDTIFRFRLGGKPRLWGFRVLSCFEVLWFDPTHQIYPVDHD